jgi:hypothetical protein
VINNWTRDSILPVPLKKLLWNWQQLFSLFFS